jgi:uroporphyrinogen decarboxylase
MPYYLEHCLGGMSEREFWDEFGFDAYCWTMPHRPAPGSRDYPDPLQTRIGFLESHRVSNDAWRVFEQDVSHDGRALTRYNFVTPAGTLTMVIEHADYTAWVVEPLVKQKSDIDLVGKYVTTPHCDVDALNRQAEDFGNRGLVRGIICPFDVFGQAGCWQDACCLVGAQRLIMETSDDPEWVHELLGILLRRKLGYVESLAGAHYDLMEHGGGDGSASVISPRLFDKFVAPYDKPLTDAAHRAGQRVVYHLCGKIMSMIEPAVDMGIDALETFTPRGMGGDTNLREAHRRISGRVCMIGGFDQLHFFTGCDEQTTRAEVRRCFAEAGSGGRYMLSPSDHFFDARSELVRAFTTEAAQCRYDS